MGNSVVYLGKEGIEVLGFGGDGFWQRWWGGIYPNICRPRGCHSLLDSICVFQKFIDTSLATRGVGSNSQ